MIEDKLLRIVIHSPTRDLFSYLQKNILYEDVEMFYFPDLLEIEEFVKRIRPHLFVIHISSDLLLNEKLIPFISSPVLQDAGVVFVLSKQIPLSRVTRMSEQNKWLVFSEESSPEFIAHNIKALLRKEKTDLEQFSSREFSENLLHCAKIINKEPTIASLFERLINFLPKIIPYDYLAIFSTDPELNQVKNFTQFIPPHQRSSAILTPSLEKLAAVWIKQSREFQVTAPEDPNLFKKLNEWGWGVKQIYFYPIILNHLTLGGIVVGQVSLLKKGKRGSSFLSEINELLGLKLYNFLLLEKRGDQKDDFTEQLISNRFSEDSILQLACKKINTMTKSEHTIFWQMNRGFGFLFPKFSYANEEKAYWKSLEKTMLFFSKDQVFDKIISENRIVQIENVFENSQLAESTLEIFRKLDSHRILLAPLRVQNEQTGVFIISRGPGKPAYTPWDINQLSVIIDRLSKVLEDTYVVKEANFKFKQLARIFELGNDIKLELNLEDILDRITKSIRKTLGWNDIAVLRSDDYLKNYKAITKVGFDKVEDIPFNFQAQIDFEGMDKFLLNCRKLSHSYFYDSNPLDIGSDEKGYVEAVAMEWHSQDLLLIPIESRKNRLGFLLVRDPVDRLKPNEDKVISLEYYANQAAVAIENASLYEHLQISEERYRTLAETMTLGLVTCSSDGNIIYVNPAFEKLVGLSKKQLLKQPINRYFSDESKSKLADFADQVLQPKERKKKSTVSNELELLSTSGEIIPVSTYTFPFIQQKGSKGFFLVLNDLRIVKKLERLKADFNSMIVHDLRSPLNVIQGFIELIRTRVVGEINSEQEELLDIAKENVKKVLNLVDNFLVASKLEVGKFGIEPKIGELNALIERIVENHRILVKSKKLVLETRLNSNLPLLYFDGLRIEQVLNNLLSNAVKHSPESGKITVFTDIFPKKIKEEEKLFARIGVKDMGPGIPAEKMQSIFDKYEQLDSEMISKSSGTGLGLAICKEIVNLHGGDIWVESEKNKGSVFYFTLPIEPSIDKILK